MAAEEIQHFLTHRIALPRAALFLSGSGSNAERILEAYSTADRAPFTIAAIITDRPEQSRALELAETYNIPAITNDIHKFYRSYGFSRVSLSSEKAQDVRRRWTDQLREQLAPLNLDFGILAGFMALTNVVEDFPCLNVHPGDLTYLYDGQRYLTGLHTMPVERALLAGFTTLRSSVIIATSYSGGGKGMDTGPILGLSEAVPVDWQEHSVEYLKQIATQRPPKKPATGYQDELDTLARHNLDRLKKYGDWIVFPRTVFDFAARRFALNRDGDLVYHTNGRWHPIQTVVYGETARRIIFKEAEKLKK